MCPLGNLLCCSPLPHPPPCKPGTFSDPPPPSLFIAVHQDKLQKEEQNSLTNQHKLTVKWRAVFRKVCANELRHDIAVLSHTFERVVAHKDGIIKVRRLPPRNRTLPFPEYPCVTPPLAAGAPLTPGSSCIPPQCLLSDLKGTELQTAHALCSYMQCVDQLLDHQRSRVSSLERQWSGMLEEISQDLKAERQVFRAP